MTSLRVGVSGCDAATADLVLQSHCQRDCEVVAAHDDDPRALAAFAAAAAVGAQCSTFADLLATGVDFVVVAGPAATRRARVENAAQQAVPCLLPAPFAPDLATATAMATACERAQARLGVLVPALHDPLYDQLRRMVAQDWLGGLTFVQSTLGDDERLRGQGLGRGHPFVELASQHVHLTSWLCGRSVLRVTAQQARALAADDDSAAATALLRGGLLATFVATRVARATGYALHGTDGGMRIAGDRLWLIGRQTFHGSVFAYDTPGHEQVLSRTELAPAIAACAPAHEPLGQFARWLEETDDFPCPAEQAIEDLRVVDALLRAAASGRAETV